MIKKKRHKLMVVLVMLMVAISTCFVSQAAEDLLMKSLNEIERIDAEMQSVSEVILDVQVQLTEVETMLIDLESKLSDLDSKLVPLVSRIDLLETEARGKVSDLTRRIEDLERDRFAETIEIDEEGWMRWQEQGDGGVFSDFSLQVDIKQVEGPPGYYGVLFRATSEDNLYYFWVQDDGYYGLSYADGENWGSLIDMTYSEAIKQNSWNNLKLEAVGPHIALYINGELLGSVMDENYIEGQVAVVAETPSDVDHIKVLFDNFSIESLE